MAMDFLAGMPIPELQQIGKRADAEAKEKAKGFEVGYERFAINGKMLGAGFEIPIRWKHLLPSLLTFRHSTGPAPNRVRHQASGSESGALRRA